jgi:hypothetical protein
MDSLLALIDKLDKEDLGATLVAGGSTFLIEAIFDLLVGVPPGTLAVVVGSITLGGKYVYNKFHSDQKKLELAYLKLSNLLSRNKYDDLNDRLKRAHELFEEEISGGQIAPRKEIETCIKEYVSRKQSPNK